jgi:hypothetical protein
MLAVADVFNLFPDKLARRCRGAFPLSKRPLSFLDRLFRGHVDLLSLLRIAV